MKKNSRLWLGVLSLMLLASGVLHAQNTSTGNTEDPDRMVIYRKGEPALAINLSDMDSVCFAHLFYEAKYAPDELSYLKVNAPKEAESAELERGIRSKTLLKKNGEIWVGETPRYFKATKYFMDKASVGLMETPFVKIDKAFYDYMASCGFKDYGGSMIQDAQGNLSPCRTLWNEELKVQALIYDFQLKELAKIRSIIEFSPQDTEPTRPDAPEPEQPSVIYPEAKDFPLLDRVFTGLKTGTIALIEQLEGELGLRTLDKEGSDEQTRRYLTLEDQSEKSNLRACNYFLAGDDGEIDMLVLDCKAVKEDRDLDRDELKKWFAANGFAFEKEKNTNKGKGAVYYNATHKVEAYIYLKSTNKVCFIELKQR